MNLDLSSLHINNEIGILFYNETVAEESARIYNEHIDKVAFKVVLKDDGTLQWVVNRDGKEVVYEDEPYAGFWSKLSVRLIRLLPVESFL